jgi:2,3-bisphosphoglycerate-independent phosphoglycerate mutase
VSNPCVVLCVLDGWGHGAPGEHNSITLAKTPHFDTLMRKYPHGLLETSGLSVGLPEGQMGNSEVGHMTLGAGRVIYQDLPRVSLAIASGQLAQDKKLQAFMTQVNAQTKVCHLMGILSDGGVHGHIDHLIALAEILSGQGIQVYIHAFLDGRDTPPQSAHTYLAQLQKTLEKHPSIRLKTLGGRYYAMDRDQRWDRVALAFNAMVHGQSSAVFTDPQAYLESSYALGQGDEFVRPACAEGYLGMDPQDGLIMVNYRADRVIQLLTSLATPDFDAFDRQGFCHTGPRLAMATYAHHLDGLYPALFPPRHVEKTLGEVVSAAGLKQLRIAETEKYAHVTYFFNAGKQEPFPQESRILVPSPKVASYDLEPQMSAPEITRHVCEALESQAYSLIVVNYANADMVGHTGNLAASIEAVECLDACVGKVTESAIACGASLLITADHGNAECMQDPHTGAPYTAHTLNAVPVILIGGPEDATLQDGTLIDVAPTVLELLGLPVCSEITGQSLLKSK